MKDNANASSLSSKIIATQLNNKLIEKKRLRRRKPRPHFKRSSNQIRSFDKRNINIPRSRGALSKVLEKYNNLAQDALSNGDRIVAENYHQFAEHYQRVLNEIADETKEESGEKVIVSEVENNQNNNEKPSRTHRAIKAKSDRIDNLSNKNTNKDNKEESKDLKNTSGDKSFTSDGIEALKPFEI